MIIAGNTFTLKRAEVSNPPLFVTLPDTDFRDYLNEVASFAESHPDVVAAIEADQDRLALEKKQMREADKKISATPDFPNLEVNGIPASASIPTLMTSRPRTPAFLVFILYMLKKFLGSVSDKQATRWMRESISLHSFLVDRHLRLPAETTMIENTNQIGAATQELIFKRQIEDILEEGLDDFKELTIDSTGVMTNTVWPTGGKKGGKAVNALQKEVTKKAQRIPVGNMLPSQIQQLDRIIGQLCSDLADARRVLDYTRKRIF
jgi:hypothetical protein